MTPTPDGVRDLFRYLEDGKGEQFFEHVADDVNWTIQGIHPVAGTYTSKKQVLDHAISRLNSILPGGVRFVVDNVYVDDDTAIVEMHTTATVDRRGVPFDNDYCWVCRFSGEEIVEVRAYLDSATVAYFIDANEISDPDPS